MYIPTIVLFIIIGTVVALCDCGHEEDDYDEYLGYKDEHGNYKT